MVRLFIVCLGIGVCAISAPEAQVKLTPEELAARKSQAGDDPARLVELLPLVDDAAARALRRQAAKLLKALPAAEHAEMAVKLSRVLAGSGQHPEEVEELLGKPATVVRQMVYRRHVEQWQYELPVPLVLRWVAERGQEPRLQAVSPVPGKFP